MSRSATLSSSTFGVSPWRGADAVKAAGLIAIGAILWADGWYQVSERAAMGDQIAPMNLAIVGVLVIGAGQASWFLAGRRAVGLRRRALLGSEAKPAAAVAGASGAGELFVGGERLFHRQDCDMVEQRSWVPASRGAHETAGRRPCGVCAP